MSLTNICSSSAGKEDKNKDGWNKSTATAISVGLPVSIFLLVVGGLMYKYLRKKNDLFMSNRPDELWTLISNSKLSCCLFDFFNSRNHPKPLICSADFGLNDLHCLSLHEELYTELQHNDLSFWCTVWTFVFNVDKHFYLCEISDNFRLNEQQVSIQLQSRFIFIVVFIVKPNQCLCVSVYNVHILFIHYLRHIFMKLEQDSLTNQTEQNLVW